jgi:hypothetical protein
MTRHHLLPRNATGFEKAVSFASDVHDRIDTAGLANMRGFKFVNTPTPFYPFIAYEYGLGEISSYFNDYPTLIDEGIHWQRVRGTPAAIERAMSWIGYDETVLEDDKRKRRMWVRWQQQMGKVPTAAEEDPLLYDAEYLGNKSDPARSYFYRGFQTYDVRALEWGNKSWGNFIWGDSSGVRMPNGKTKWSHGQAYSAAGTASDPLKAALGVDFIDGDELPWGAIPWDTDGLIWDGVDDVRKFKWFMLSGYTCFIAFYDASDAVIGYRRAFKLRDVTDVSTGAENVKVQAIARTDFGNGFGNEAAKVAVVFDAEPAAPHPVGRLWLPSGGLSFDAAKVSAKLPLSIALRRTVRELVQITFEF